MLKATAKVVSNYLLALSGHFRKLARLYLFFVVAGLFCSFSVGALLPQTTQAASGVLTDCTENGLRTQIDNTPAGGTITFNCAANPATIILAAPIDITANTNLDGGTLGRVILSGNNATRLFNINAGVSFTLQNLTLTNGRQVGTGVFAGAIYVNTEATVNLSNSSLTNHSLQGGAGGAIGNGGDVYGGSIFNEGGTLNINNSTISQSSAIAGNGGTTSGNGGLALGGAIFSRNGTINITNSLITANSAVGGDANGNGFTAGFALGGAIYQTNTTLTITATASFQNNQAKGGNGVNGNSSGSYARGGTVYSDGGSISVNQSSFSGNKATGGNKSYTNSDANFGAGGAIIGNATTVNISGASFSGNQAEGGLPLSSPNGGSAYGGAIYVTSGTTTLNNSSLLGNSATAPTGAGNNFAIGGGLHNDSDSTANILNTTFDGNKATGSNNSAGGGAANYSVIFFSTNTNSSANGSTFSNNEAGRGGGFYNHDASSSTLNNAFFAGNKATTSDGGGVSSAGNITVTRSTFAGNTAVTDGGGISLIMTATYRIANSTFSTNSALNGGGLSSNTTSSPKEIINSTFAFNTKTGAGRGDNLFNVQPSVSPVLRNSLIAGVAGNENCYQPFLDGGNNLDSGATCGFSTATKSLSNTDPKLEALAANGGPTKTHALGLGSPAIDKGDQAVCLAAPVNGIDQRGFSRISGVGIACDIGAIEMPFITPAQPPATPITYSGTQVHQSPILNSYTGLNFQPCLQFWDFSLPNETLPLKSAGVGQPGFVVNGNRAAGITSENPEFSCNINLTVATLVANSPLNRDNQPPLEPVALIDWEMEFSAPAPTTVIGWDKIGNIVDSKLVPANTFSGQTTKVTLSGKDIVRVEVKPNFNGLPAGTPTRCDLNTNPLFRYCVVLSSLKVKVVTVVDNNGFVLFDNTVRLFASDAKTALIAVGENPQNPPSTSSTVLPFGGKAGIPANAKGVIGNLTAISCTGGGNLRFWTGTDVPFAGNLNIPGAVPGVAKPNMSTGFITPLDANGNVNLGLGAAKGVTCGYLVDVVGYITDNTLLPKTYRLAYKVKSDEALVATGGTPSNPSSPSSVSLQVAGTGGVPGIPPEAKGVMGVLVAVNCTAGGNFRLWTGTTVPNASNLNIPGADFGSATKPNFSTSFITPLDANGRVNLGLGSAPGTRCGYVVDIVGWINGEVLLPATIRLARVEVGAGLVSEGQTPQNPASAVKSSASIAVRGVAGIPTDTKGVIGVLTALNCTGGGNLRFWTGTTVPNAANLNIPGSIKPNVSTSFVAALDANGKLSLGLGSAVGVRCGYQIDIVGYFR
jgi:hypothetical protein